MKTCKDCLHYKACKGTYMNVSEYKSITDFDSEHYADIYHCPDFADKSEWVHLPCKVGDTAYYVVGYGNNARIIEEGLKGVVIFGDKLYVVDECKDFYEVGVEVFLSKQEAEKALAERRMG